MIPESLEDIGRQIGAWASGEPDERLDEWYAQYGGRNPNGDPKEILRGNGGELLQNAAGSGRIKRDGADRASEHSQNWTHASLSDTIKRLGLTQKSGVNDTGKIIYSRPDSNVTVVFDTKGNYFRVQDSSISPRKRSAYLDIDGRPAQNIVENGKTRGRTKDEFQRDTHFLNTDQEEE